MFTLDNNKTIRMLLPHVVYELQPICVGFLTLYSNVIKKKK